jgi:hypothetical protein
VVVGERTLQWDKSDFLDDHVSVRVREDFLLDAVAAIRGNISQFINWYAGLERHILENAITFFLGKETLTVRDEKPLVPSAGLIHARVVDLV